MGERDFVQNLGKKRGTLGDEIQNERTVLKLLLSDQNVRVWSRFIMRWRGKGFRLLFGRLSKCGCHKRIIFQRVAE